MTKKEVLQLIQNPKALTESRLNDLEKIAEEFPYFQGARNLIAIGYRHYRPSLAKRSLSLASLYASDRHFLKDLLERPWEPTDTVTDETVHQEADSVPKAKTASVGVKEVEKGAEQQMEVNDMQDSLHESPKEEKSPSDIEPATIAQKDIDEVAATAVHEHESVSVVTISHNDLVREVFENLEALKRTKTKYLEVEKRMEDAEFEAAQANAVKKATAKTPKPKLSAKEPPTTTVKSKGEQKQKPDASVSKSKNTSPAASKPQPTKTSSINSTAVPATQTVKKIDQTKIIDEFIKMSPSITPQALIQKKKDTKSDPADLSEPSQKLKDDLVTENLALILVKQGKNEKAIEVYKKLIWKFPQKKAYFATQIKELQK